MEHKLTNEKIKKNSSKIGVKALIVIGMLTGLNIVAYMIDVQTPWGSMIHLGNIVSFAIAIAFGPLVGGLVSGLSAALFDLVGGHAHYTLWSLAIKGLSGFAMGYVAFLYCKKGKSLLLNLAAWFTAALVNLVGYFICWSVMYGYASASLRVPSSLVSSLIGLAGIPLGMAIIKALGKKRELSEL